MKHDIVTLDVREDIRAGREPFSKIMGAVASLKADESLRLIAPFEPVPLFGIMAQRGFTHQSKTIETGDWEVLFERGQAGVTATKSASQSTVRIQQELDVIELDARGLEPPQPLVAILEEVARLTPDRQLSAHTDRRPMHLYPLLIERGFVGESEEQADGSFITRIRANENQ